MHPLCSVLELLPLLPNGTLTLGKGAGARAEEQELLWMCRGQGMETAQGRLLSPGCQLKSIFSWQQTTAYIWCLLPIHGEMDLGV